MPLRSEIYLLEEKCLAKYFLNYFKVLMNCTVAVQQKFRGERAAFPHFLIIWCITLLLSK